MSRDRAKERRLGDYVLEGTLGHGGMATVFSAVHTRTGERVALKLLRPELVNHPEAHRRFMDEAQAASQVRHPNIVEIREVGIRNNVPYIAMERLSGESLLDILTVRRQLPWEETLEYLAPIMEALALVHARGLVHRDLKPSNIFVTQTGAGLPVAKLLDFGIAKVLGRDAKTQHPLGTPQYMPPEQLEAPASVTPSADVWAMGVIFYRCLTGDLPFYRDESGNVPGVASEEERQALAEVDNGQSPKSLILGVEKALSPAPSDRFPDMGGFLRYLHAHRLVTNRSVPPRLHPASMRWFMDKRPKALMWALGGGLLTLLFLGLWSLFRLLSDDGTRVEPLREAPPRAQVAPSSAPPKTAAPPPPPDAGLPPQAGPQPDARSLPYPDAGVRVALGGGAFEGDVGADAPMPPAAGTAAASEAARERRRDARLAFEKARAAMARGKRRTARRAYDRALEQAPDFVAALAGRADLLRQLGDSEGALTDLQTALRLEPNRPALLNARGRTHLALGQLEEAIKDFERATERAPDEKTFRTNLTAALFHRARVRQSAGATGGARRDLDRILVLDPRHTLALRRRGILRLQDGDKRGGERDLERYLALRPAAPDRSQIIRLIRR